MDGKRIFISYCREDAAFARLLKTYLEEAHLCVWMDSGIPAGETWRDAIDHAILESEALVVILSAHSASSRYVNYEWAFALGAGLTVVPLLLGPPLQDLHPALAARERLDFPDPPSGPWNELLSRVKELSGSGHPARKPAPFTAIEDAARGLDSLDAAERLRAIGTLKQMNNPAATEILVRALQHPVSNVRLEAALALLESQDARTIPVLLESVVADKEYRRLDWEQLRRIGPAAVPVMLEVLRHKDADVRRLAAIGLGEFKDSSALPALTEALEDEDTWVRAAAVRALGEYGLAAPVRQIVELLRDEKTVRWDAAKVLGRIGGTEAVGGLIQVLNDPDWDVRNAVIRALGQARDTVAIPPLVELLKNEPNFNYRHNAVEALGAIGGPAAVAGLAEVIQDDENRDVRYSAFDGLATIGGAEAVAVLLNVLRNPESEDRDRAAIALGKLKDHAAIPDLLRALRDSDEWLRKLAVEALGEIKAEAAATGIMAALGGDDNHEVRRAAAVALGNIGGQAAVPALVAALKDSDEQVRQAACAALVEIRTPEAKVAVRAFRRSKSTSA